LEDNFEEMQIDSMNFVLNTGSIVIPILPGILVQQLIIIEGSIWLFRKCIASKKMRSIGKVIIS